jgi:hypothetical protein
MGEARKVTHLAEDIIVGRIFGGAIRIFYDPSVREVTPPKEQKNGKESKSR